MDEDWIKHWVHVKNLDENEEFEHGEGDILTHKQKTQFKV